MANVSSSNTTTLYSTTQTTPIVPGAAVTTGAVNNTNFTTLYSQTNGVPGGGASDDLLVKGNLRVLGTSDLEGQVTIGNSYSLPTTDGTAGQVMTTDGNGHVTFEDVSASDPSKLVNGVYEVVLNSNATMTFPNNVIDFGNQTADLKSSSYSELWYRNATATPPPGQGIQTFIWAWENQAGIVVDSVDYGYLEWNFNANGTFKLPTNALLGDLNNDNGVVLRANAGATTLASYDQNQNVIADDGAVYIQTLGTTVSSRQWIFSQDGRTQFPDYTFPYADGSANQVLETDGSGNLSWVNASGAGTTYTYTASSTTGGANLDLIGSDATTNTIKLTNAGHITAVYTSATEVTLGSDATDANTVSTIVARDGSGNFSASQGTFTGVKINGSTSGTVQFAAPAIAGTQAYTLPTALPGTSGYVLSATTGGVMSWVNNTSTSTFGNITIGVDTAQTISTTSGNLILQTAAGVNSGKITINAGIGGDITVQGQGSGSKLNLVASETYLGRGGGTSAFLSTNGAGSLILSTNLNGGLGSGIIGINAGLNQPITIQPDGTGRTLITNTTLIGGMILNGSTSGTVSITPSAVSGTQAYTLPTAVPAVSGYVLSATTGGVMSWVSNTTSTGNVTVGVDTVQTISTTSGNLILQTAAGVNSGTITLASGANGNITLAPNGTGRTSITNGTIANNLQFNGSTSGTVQFAAPAIAGTQAYTLPTALPGTSGYVLSATTGGVMSWVNNTSTSTFGNVTIGVDTVQTISTTSGSLILQTAAGVNSGTITINAGAGADMVLSPNPLGEVYLDADVYVGRASTNVQISSNGNADLYLVTGNGAGGGQVRIYNGANADVEIRPDGTGNVLLTTDTVVVGDAGAGNATVTNINTGFFSFVHATWGQGLDLGNDGSIGITPGNDMGVGIGDNVGANPVNILSGSSGILLSTDVGNPSSITIPGTANGHIVIAPDGTGDVRLDADTVRVGDSGAAATIISNGAGALTVTTGGAANLTLSTNNGSNSGTIAIANGVNGNITFAPNGTGQVVIDGGYWPTTSTSVTVNSVLTNDGSGNLSWALPGGGGSTFGNVSIGVDTDQTISTTSGNLVLQTAAGVNAGTITLASGTNGDITIEPNGTGDVFLNTDLVRIGDANAAATLTTNGTGNLTLSTNNGTNSGTILINQGTNGNIELSPNGTGDVLVNADTLQVGDAGAAATVTTNGAGNLTLSTNNGSNSGTILITQGANANITLTPNGTGDVILSADTVQVGDANATATLTTNGTGDLVLNTNNGTNAGSITLANGANASITITPNGTGDVVLNADTVSIGDTGAIATLTSNGAGDLQLNTNSGVNSGTITIANGANGNITIAPNGTGDVYLDADTVRVGDSGAAATITTNGAGNLTISTNNGTNAGTLVFANGVNGNVTLTPNGSGVFNPVGVTVASHTPAAAGVNPLICRSIVTIGNSIRWGNINLQKTRSDILLAAMTNEPAVQTYSVRDSASVNRIFASHRAVYQGTGTNPYFAFDASIDGFTTTINSVNFNDSQANWGNSTGNYTHSTISTGNLILNTNQGTTTGSITVNSGANGNIALAPIGTGRVTITNPLRLASYTAAALTALTGAVGDVAAVTNSAQGSNPNGMLAFWDTTNARWSYVHDNSAV